MKKISSGTFLIRFLHWEYWPFHFVYGPIYLYWFVLCIRARSLFFFNASNPTIRNGGFLLESKKEIYDIMPQEWYPPTIFFKQGTHPDEISARLHESGLTYPLIGKPDIGMRGLGVEKLYTPEEVFAYAKKSRVDFLLQEFIHFEYEAGIFYYRYPDSAKGHISGIVGKEFLTLTGDGVSTMETLLQKDQRFILQIASLKETKGEALQEILSENETRVLVPYGNHARGAKFLDLSELIDERLSATIDTLSQQIPGFYFGRMDIRYKDWESLKNGKDFSIIELNGAGSEPAHIYDPRHSIFFAWKEIIRHWHILLIISRQNHLTKKVPYMSFTAGWLMLRENSTYVKKLLGSV